MARNFSSYAATECVSFRSVAATSLSSSLTLSPPAQLVDDLVLELEDVADRPVDLDGAKHRARRHLDHPGGDPDLFPQALVAAGDEPGGAELAPHVDGEPLVEIAGVA